MRDGSAIEGDRDACRRGGSREFDDEVEDSVPDFDIGGLGFFTTRRDSAW